jgi:hypothetical protein
MPQDEAAEMELIQRWFEERGFRLEFERETADRIWADLQRLPSGRKVAPRYGRGDSELAAARRAKERYEQE